MQVEYRFLTAEEWGLHRSTTKARTERMPDDEAVLHHRAGNPRHSADAKIAFKEMNDSALAKGYWCVAYDILVHEQYVSPTHRIITIGEGRGPYLSGATKSRNEEAEALCAIGYFHPNHGLSEEPSEYLLEGIALGFAWGIDKGWISKLPNIYGHRDNPSHPGATSCPGDLLYRHLPSIRSRVAELTQKVPSMLGFINRTNTAGGRYDSRVKPNEKLEAGVARTIKLPGAAGMSMVKINLVTTQSEGPGFFSCWDSGNRPESSCLNWDTAKTLANEVSVTLAADGSFRIWSPVATHVVIDLVGFYKTI